MNKTEFRKTPLNRQPVYLAPNKKKFILECIKECEGDAYVKSGTFTTEIVWGNKSFIFSNQKKRDHKHFKQGMFLFGMVKKDAKLFIGRKKIKLPKKQRSLFYNEDATFDDIDHKITATDLNHAYWRIALNLGIISEHTYIKGIDDKFKETRLAALSTLGRRKQYAVIKKGKETTDVLVIEGDEKLSEAYTLIRYTCYKYMNELRKMLGTDFLAYRTDCIYFIDTKENREKVAQYFGKKDLLVKQLS